MPELTYNAFTQHLRKMFDFSAFNGTRLPLPSNEEPTIYDEKQDYQPQYSKLSVGKPVPHSSLLTEALSSPELVPVDRGRCGREIQPWSLSSASTAELTSDGGLSSSSHSPNPTPPEMLHTFRRMLQNYRPSPKPDSKNHPRPIHVVGGDDTIEYLARRRCIRFACNAEPPSRRSSTDDYFDERPAATLKEDTSEPAQLYPIPSPRYLPPGRQPRTLVKGRSIPASNVNSKISPQLAQDSMNSAMRFHEFASSCEETESWMIQVPDKSRLLRVDGVLAKENEIRKLSEEVEAEARQEKEDEEELGDMDDEEDELADGEVEDSEVDEDDESSEDEDDEVGDDGEEDYLSGNESDNEEGFASDSDESDGSFFSGPRHFIPMDAKPSYRHNAIPSSIHLPTGISTHLDQHLTKIQLPDSTDFVCGTFDEDKALEDAYVCALVEQKRAKYGITPQDIDPSFPTSESDSEEECRIQSPRSLEQPWARGRMNLSEEEVVRGTGLHSILTQGKCPNEGKIRFNSPAPKRRVYEPASKHRFISPPATQRGFRISPPARRNSNDHSPRPTMSRRGTRALSPPPPVRKFSHLNFTRGHIERTKSLPKTTKLSLKSFGNNTEGISTNDNAGIRTRGAIDIVKGLEKRRERRHNKWARQRDSLPKKGEGVEKMRELGLMLGKGKQAQWMISV